MNDMSGVIIPRSDQVNAEDYLAGPKTYAIEAVEIRPGTEQPVSIKLAGEPRVWRPCKSMSRVLVAAWGPDANAYVGRSVTLYNDPKVKWGGMEVGGIRVSHMSHIERDMLLQLTATKGKRAPHVVKALKAEVRQLAAVPSEQTEDRAVTWTDKYIADLKAAFDNEELASIREKGAKALAKIQATRKDLYSRIIEADPLSAISPATGTEAEPASTNSGEQAAPGQGGEA